MTEPALEAVATAVYRFPTEQPEADGTLMQFRNNQLLKARDTNRKNVQAGAANAAKVRDAVKAALTPKN